MRKAILKKLKDYFEKEPDVILAFLFGSAAQGRMTEESDVDIAVYFQNSQEEDRIWSEVSGLLRAEVDLVRLNDAPTTLISAILKTGIPLALKSLGLYRFLYLDKSLEAEDFTEFAKDYRKIYKRSHSLAPEDQTRLLERTHFLEDELAELPRFQSLTLQEYQNERPKKREIERWTENILNALIDIAKIILASERKKMPKTYGEALREFALLAGLSSSDAERFSRSARLRNLLAHEYLDLLYVNIRRFIDEFPLFCQKILDWLRSVI